jgi:hypothetical protein
MLQVTNLHSAAARLMLMMCDMSGSGTRLYMPWLMPPLRSDNAVQLMVMMQCAWGTKAWLTIFL